MRKLWGVIVILGLALIGAVSFDLLVSPRDFSAGASKGYARVVTLAPSMSETMVALGEDLRVVGVTIHCTMEALRHAQKIGSFAEPNFEAILALNPDLVLAVPHVMAKNTLDRLRANNIEVFAHQPDTLKDIKYIIEMLAKKLGIEVKGAALCHAIDQAIKEARQGIKSRSHGDAPQTTLIAVSPEPFVVAGSTSFPSQVVEALGLINLADDRKTAWPVWPLESLLARPPMIIILADGRESLARYQKIFRALGLDLAQRKIRLILPDRPIFQSPSPALIHDASYLSQLLQKES
ncbi:MAG TPA: helical backbone metal receptor [Myxococcota bacterium]|nr:helical backbone metal receptor [Myxococcota bacterium]